MKILFIRGTGNISTAVSRLSIKNDVELYHLNRGLRKSELKNIKTIVGDINDENEIEKILNNHVWDVVVNWIAFTPKDIERDFRLFSGKTKQYIFISSASVYQKPLSFPVITESTPLKNPYWDYSNNKIECEIYAQNQYRNYDFPITIVRPSLTFETVLPVAIGSWDDYTIVDRMKRGKPIIVHDDGTSFWTVTHSEDFAKGIIGLFGNDKAIGHAFHITSDEILTWNKIYELIAASAGVKANLIHIPSEFIINESRKIDWTWMGGDFMKGNLLGDKAESAIFDNSKIKTFVPEFKATISFEEGIKRTLNWFEADPKRMIVHDENNRYMDAIINAFLQKNQIK